MDSYKARVEYKVTDASELTYSFPFSYLKKKFVCVKTRDANNVETPLTYGVDYTVDNLTITLVKAPVVNTTLIIYRQTDTNKIVSWNDGSILLAADMSIEEVQLLHLNEEESDYLAANSISRTTDDNKQNIWDSQNQRIVNIKDPVNVQDAVTKGYMETVEGGFVKDNTALKDESTKQAQESKVQQEKATTSANNSANSATLSQKWAESADSPDGLTDADSNTGNTLSSKLWALFAKAKAIASDLSAKASANSATASANSATASATSASNAKTSETNAKTSETNAKASETASKTSETNALASANASAASANSAMTSETNAFNYMTNANTAMADCESIKTSLTNVFHFKGSKTNYSDLPTTGNQGGDVWNIEQADDANGIKAGDNVVWVINSTTSYWDNFSGSLAGVVKSINGTLLPDTSGNVSVPVPAVMTGATSTVAGASGLVPTPSKGANSKYLKGDGTWGTITIPTSLPANGGNADTVYSCGIGISGYRNDNMDINNYINGGFYGVANNAVNLPSGANTWGVVSVFPSYSDTVLQVYGDCIGDKIYRRCRADSSWKGWREIPSASGNTLSFGTVTIGVD